MKHGFKAILVMAVSYGSAALGSFQLTSNLKSGQAIPQDYYAGAFGCEAKNLSPALKWKGEPAGTKSFAVTVYDKDAPTGSGFWHYVLFDVPAMVHQFNEGDLSAGKVPEGSVASMTDAGKPGYFGPCPPPGRKHTYVVTVYALKTEKLGVEPTSTPAFVGFNLWGNTLAKASFTMTAGPRK